jgi:hypothetical protein
MEVRLTTRPPGATCEARLRTIRTNPTGEIEDTPTLVLPGEPLISHADR